METPILLDFQNELFLKYFLFEELWVSVISLLYTTWVDKSLGENYKMFLSCHIDFKVNLHSVIDWMWKNLLLKSLISET